MNILDATRLATAFIAKYCTPDVCQRAVIAGSIRRGKAEPGDIEVVCQPVMGGMFGDTPSPEFYARLDNDPPGKRIKGKTKYRQYDLGEIVLDLFIVTPPAEWGVILTIRTGPAEFSHNIVTPRYQGGYLPGYAHVKDGSVWVGDKIIPMPEERDFLEFLGLPGDLAPGER